jgi:hypothetical protein
LPPGGCFGSEDPKCRPRDQMSLMVEGVVDGGMDVEKTLRGSSRLEPLHLALSSPHDLMGVFSVIVFSAAPIMRAGEAQLPESRAVGAQLVGVTSNFGAKPCFLNRHSPPARPAASMTQAKSNRLVHPPSSSDSFDLRHYFKAKMVEPPQQPSSAPPSKPPKNVRLSTGTS